MFVGVSVVVGVTDDVGVGDKSGVTVGVWVAVGVGVNEQAKTLSAKQVGQSKYGEADPSPYSSTS